jgi:hypothetical protein
MDIGPDIVVGEAFFGAVPGCGAELRRRESLFYREGFCYEETAPWCRRKVS